MADDTYDKLARQVRAVALERGLRLGRDLGHPDIATPARGLLSTLPASNGEIAEPSPEERAEEVKDAIRWHAERLSELGGDKTADAVLKALGPKRPRGAPRSVSNDDAAQLAAESVLWSMHDLLDKAPLHEVYSRALRKHLPSGVKYAAFRRRVDRLCEDTFGLTPAELLRLPEQK